MEHPLHTEYPEGDGQMPFTDQQDTCRPAGQTSMNPQAACGGYRVAPVFHSRDENHIVPSLFLLNPGFN